MILSAFLPRTRYKTPASSTTAWAVGSARFWKGVWIAGLPIAERHRGWYATYTDHELRRLLGGEMRGVGDQELRGEVVGPLDDKRVPGEKLHRGGRDKAALDDADADL